MIRKYLLPVLAIAGVIFAIRVSLQGSRPIIPARPVAMPAESGFAQSVAGAGIVEASGQNIAIGTPVSGLVMKVLVEVGQQVKGGDALLQLDDRDLQAELIVRKSTLASAVERRKGVESKVASAKDRVLSAKAKLERLEKLPRAEDVPPVEAKLREALAQREDAQSQYEMWAGLAEKRAVSQDEFLRKRFALESAKARYEQVAAELALLKAGAFEWDKKVSAADVSIAQAEAASAEADLAVSGAEIEGAKAQVEQTQRLIERLTVKAPKDGQILQLNVRAGEFASAGVLQTPLMLMGNTNVLWVRVDVDENDAWRITPGTAARASVRGNRDIKTDLAFVRIEPYVVPKKSLTGDSAERVDTRVLQVIYSFKREQMPSVYVGQQMDVFIEAKAGGATRPSVPDVVPGPVSVAK